EEEQRVLDDRTADVEAAGPVLRIVAVLVAMRVAGQPAGLADQLVGIAVRVVRRAVEFVGAGLGHGVDIGADRVADHVVVGGGDVVLGDRLRRDRRFLIRQAVGVQAERVTLAYAVDGDVVVTVVLAVGRDR